LVKKGDKTMAEALYVFFGYMVGILTGMCLMMKYGR